MSERDLIPEMLRERLSGRMLLSNPPQAEKDWLCQAAADEIDLLRAQKAKLREALKDVLLDVDFMVERDVLPDIRSDILYERARAVLQETETKGE